MKSGCPLWTKGRNAEFQPEADTEPTQLHYLQRYRVAQPEQVRHFLVHPGVLVSSWGLVPTGEKMPLQIIRPDHLMMWNTISCGLCSFTFVSVASAFTGILFSQTSSDSRTSNTVLADTKGGMFSLKKEKYSHLFCLTRSFFVVCLNHYTSAQKWKKAIQIILEEGKELEHRSWNCAEVMMDDLKNDCLPSHWNQLAR